MTHLIFIKLGGSLITDKSRPHSARLKTINRIARELAESLSHNPDLRLVIGHGSGSFGHVPAHRYHTRQGVASPDEWRGYAEVWHEARRLNQIVLESFYTAGLGVIAFPPSACAVTREGTVASWDLSNIKAALHANLIPLVNGDVVIDQVLGGTILSTEDVFSYLAPELRPERILLAGLEPGVWADFPACTRLHSTITSKDRAQISAGVSGSAAVDVTGGMLDKVHRMLDLVQQMPDLEGMIFSGEVKGQIEQALSGASFGTVIRGTQDKE